MDQTRGTRPSALHHLLHDRAVRFAAGLAVVVAIPVAVLFYFQFRSLNDIEKTSGVVLRQLSGDTADVIAKAIDETLKRPHIDVLLRITAQRTEPLDLAWINPVFEEGLKESPFIDEFWVWSAISPDRADHWYVFDRNSLKEPVDAIDRSCRRCSTGNAGQSMRSRPRSTDARNTSRCSCVFRDRRAIASRASSGSRSTWIA
jgi:hypothetical protein